MPLRINILRNHTECEKRWLSHADEWRLHPLCQLISLALDERTYSSLATPCHRMLNWSVFVIVPATRTTGTTRVSHACDNVMKDCPRLICDAAQMAVETYAFVASRAVHEVRAAFPHSRPQSISSALSLFASHGYRAHACSVYCPVDDLMSSVFKQSFSLGICSI